MSTLDLFSYFRKSKITYAISFFDFIIPIFISIGFLNKIFSDLYYDFDINPIDF